MTRNRKRLFKQFNAMLTPLTKNSIKLDKCFSSVWYVIPPLLLGAILVFCGLYLTIWRWKTSEKNNVGMSDWFYWSKCLPNPNGGIQWLLVKPWTSSIGQCVRYPPNWQGEWEGGQIPHCRGKSVTKLGAKVGFPNVQHGNEQCVCRLQRIGEQWGWESVAARESGKGIGTWLMPKMSVMKHSFVPTLYHTQCTSNASDRQ